MRFIDMDEISRQVAEKIAADAEEAGQMTLGGLIAALKLLPADMSARVDVYAGGLCSPHSYRGYYEQLSFSPDTKPTPVGAILADAEQARGKVYQGYKGGDYLMTGTTAIWAAEYGDCGRRIVGIEVVDGTAVIRTAEDLF